VKVSRRKTLRNLRAEDAGPPWQEVVPLRRPGQAVVQTVAEDADGVVGLVSLRSLEATLTACRNLRAPRGAGTTPHRRAFKIATGVYPNAPVDVVRLGCHSVPAMAALFLFGRPRYIRRHVMGWA
jgi:hypothetical protein